MAALVEAMRERPALPRRQRALFAVLARGLDPDPARRWPDVDALSAALDRAARRARRAAVWRAARIAAVATIVVGAAVAGAVALGVAR